LRAGTLVCIVSKHFFVIRDVLPPCPKYIGDNTGLWWTWEGIVLHGLGTGGGCGAFSHEHQLWPLAEMIGIKLLAIVLWKRRKVASRARRCDKPSEE
jgi:hypothetical protein